MLDHIARLEGAMEAMLSPSQSSSGGGREMSIVRTKLMEARLAEAERLRVAGEDPQTIADTIAKAHELGRRGELVPEYAGMGGGLPG